MAHVGEEGPCAVAYPPGRPGVSPGSGDDPGTAAGRERSGTADPRRCTTRLVEGGDLTPARGGRGPINGHVDGRGQYPGTPVEERHDHPGRVRPLGQPASAVGREGAVL